MMIHFNGGLLVLVSTALRLGDIMYLILMLAICIVTVIVKGCVMLEIPSMHKLVQYFQTLYELKGVPIMPPWNLIFSQAMLNIVVYQMFIHVVTKLCSCKQCCPMTIYAMCYSPIDPCGYWT